MNRPRCAVIGAGPIGIEAALEARARGLDVVVYEAGRIGEHLRRFGWVRLFTPFSMNASDRGRALLRGAGIAVPEPNSLLTAEELVASYLVPLTQLPGHVGMLREHSRVTHVGRLGLVKTEAVAAAGDPSRAGRTFVLRVVTRNGGVSFEEADIVIDATGIYSNPNATGPAGLPAAGEDALGDRVVRQIPDIPGRDRARYAARRILLVGDGHSAATAIVALADLIEAEGRGSVLWITRGGADSPIPVLADDPLPARRDVSDRANAIARNRTWLRHRPGTTIMEYRDLGVAGVDVSFETAAGERESVVVDEVIALVGYRPDLAMSRELQVHWCYASEGTMALASALLAASVAEPGRISDCLTQTGHGAESLRNPEPGYFVLGAKSYGRNPDFILSVGHQQVRDAFGLVEGARPRVPMTGRG